MFERYTEKARSVIFFVREEASQFGSPYIETEHMLMGWSVRTRYWLSGSCPPMLPWNQSARRSKNHLTIREKVPTSVDLPLSRECVRVLEYAAEEAERLNHKYIGTAHLLLGLLREENCFAAEILQERGLQLSIVREQLSMPGL